MVAARPGHADIGAVGGAACGIDVALEQAAQNLGASPMQAFLKITLPLAGSSLFVSAFFAFIISINEFVMAQFLATPLTQTLSTLIWSQLRYNLTPLVAAASSLLLSITLAALVVASRVINLRKLI
jgi:ABC-type spermidine/putrescine transport system permease subunit II